MGVLYRVLIKRGSLRMLALALLLPAFTALAATPVRTVKTDLRPLIRAAMGSPSQFAVLVPHAASPSTAGSWSSAGGRATWHYAVRVPSAISMSFHATDAVLPDSASLVVRSARTTVSYRARDLHHRELWSRIQPGEALEFELSVAAADRDTVSLNIVSLQAGYRAIGAGVQDHPYYRTLRAQVAAGTANAACVTNYECEITGGNAAPAAATLALVVGNQYECSGTLINDVPQDNTPYVLTARHCETGTLGGGNPAAAATISAYWDATAACTGALGSIYSPNIPAQTGAQTVVEQQDAWLVLLDENPVVSDAQFAGFDASGGGVQGGYTIHHAEGGDKQYVRWSGMAAAIQQTNVLSSNYRSNFWDTVNALGNIGPGASGSGLFDQNNHLVGSLTLGRTTTDASGYGACPATPPPTPNGSNGVADFTILAAVWASVADASSSTGSVTLMSVLDPGHTGTVVVPSAPAVAIALNASADSISDGQSLQMTWNVAGATQCAAGGGIAGDGWTGTLGASGTKTVSESVSDAVTYSLSCSFSGGRAAHTAVIVTWLGPQPVVQLSGANTVWTTTPATLTWTSNVGPCALSGGGLALTNLPTSGTASDTQASPADVNYTLTCGSAVQNSSSVVTVSYVTPSLVMNANGTDRKIGETFFLQWTTYADSCTPSGGAPGDGWGGTSFTGFYARSQEPYYLTVTTPGTYTYSLTCSTGTLSVQQSVTVTFENNAPYVSDSLSTATVTYSASPADYVTLSFNSNLSSCGFTSTPTGLIEQIATDPYGVQGQAMLEPSQSGTYQLSQYCYSAADPSAPAVYAPTLTLTVLPPAAPAITISFNPTAVVAGQSFQAAWNATNSQGCTFSDGIAGTPWGSTTQGVPPTGYEVEVAPAAGQYTFGLTCSSIDASTAPVSAQETLTVGPLDAQLATSAASASVGQSFTLSWTSDGATSCAAGGGGATGAPWSGTLAPSGSVTQMATTVGSFTYTLTCTGGGVTTAPQTVAVQVVAATSSGGTGSTTGTTSTAGTPTSGGGKGGGGGIGFLELLLLAALQGLRGRRRGTKANAHQ